MTRFLALVLALFLVNCDQSTSKVSWSSTTAESACDAALELMARLSQQKIPSDIVPFLTADKSSVSTNCARVNAIAGAGYGSEYLVLRLAGYAVWVALIDANLLAQRGIFVDAAKAANACVGLGILACDIVGWESIRAEMSVIN